MSVKEDKLNFIKQFAFDQFKMYGFSRVTMDEIAKQTQTGKGTLYRYFPSKEELLIAAVQKNIGEVEKNLKQELTGDKDPIAKLNCYIALLSQKLKFVQVSQLSDIERNVPKAYQLICEARERIIFEQLSLILEEGKESGFFRSDLDVTLAVNILVGASQYITTPSVLDSLSYKDLTEVVTTIFSTFLKGCYSEMGRSGNWEQVLMR
ncbi:MAG: TetR/AcrR family transcriptional regulator [Velocimicrobium sp.]